MIFVHAEINILNNVSPDEVRDKIVDLSTENLDTLKILKTKRNYEMCSTIVHVTPR